MKDVLARYSRLLSLKERSENRVRALESEISTLEGDLDMYRQAGALLDRITEEEVESGIQTYIALLEQGLKAIFPEQDVGLVGEIDKVRGKVSLRLKTTFKGQDGLEIEGEGLDAFGGAVSTIQSLLLRISLILKRNLKPVLLLDESFPAVDGERVDLLVDFLKALCVKLDMEILCITHNPSIAEKADLAYRIASTKDGAKLKKIEP